MDVLKEKPEGFSEEKVIGNMRQVLKDEEYCAEWLGGELGFPDRGQLGGG